MAIIANTYTRYSVVGIREELSNIIYNISPEETPFQSNGGRETVKKGYSTDVLTKKYLKVLNSI